jgi:tetratricopeptide (TPR) repeat protein
MRANFEWQRGQTEKALKYYERCIELDGEFLLARYDYGLALFDLSRYAECLEQLAVVEDLEPDFAEGWLQYAMGSAELNLRRFPQAELHFQAAKSMGRNEAEVHRGLARSLMAQGKYPEAISAFKQLLAIEPGDWRAEILLGNCHQQLNQIPAAIAHWEKALEQMPIPTLEYTQLMNKVRLLSRFNKASPIRRGSPNANPPLRGTARSRGGKFGGKSLPNSR